MIQGSAYHITGIVQGVGFRPFVYNLAVRYGLTGWVRNTSEGVFIRVDGTTDQFARFEQALRTETPPLAHIETSSQRHCDPGGFTRFEILESAATAGGFQPISPDVGLCDDCRRELLDSHNRRYRYPFINCTNCGPRFTIIKDIPYDRPQTTMHVFPMCEACAAEYHDPTDRRFHAQPVACPDCGPNIWLIEHEQRIAGDDALRHTVKLLQHGKIVAIKGLGGFHLACDATNTVAVETLRQRKHRPAKPFAVMMADLTQAQGYCECNAAETELLTSSAAPIVLLRRRQTSEAHIANAVAPGQNTLGVMLPYTPLHLLLFDDNMPPLVMTSGNHSNEPIVTTNEQALQLLAPLADAFLLHNRDIHIRTDDSVMRIWNGVALPMRRSRGYSPFPVALPFIMPPVLAVGAELKNTFCLTHNTHAFMSHHIGNMENYSTLQSFEDGIAHFEQLFRATPQLIVHDLHPDYLSTRYGKERSEFDQIPRVAVQHHHAHIATCMIEHGLDGTKPVIGVCFDGTGYGPDGTIWGGEFLLADYHHFERRTHLKPLPLPGGDTSTRKPARIAMAYLTASELSLDAHLPPIQALSATERQIVQQQIEKGINTPFTSSMGRLFDAVSALLGLCMVATYEGQAAIELEAITTATDHEHYPLPHTQEGIDPGPLLAAIIKDMRANIDRSVIATRFHNSIARMIVDTCQRIRKATNINDVALSGGVFQNVTLLSKAVPLLEAAGFRTYTHRRVPPNDGGLALGQAVIGYIQVSTSQTDKGELL